MLKGLTMVVLPVSDWAKSREWWTGKFGLTPVYEQPEDNYGEYTLGLHRPSSGVKVLRGPIRVEDIVRWGVWLGRHIC